LNEVINDNADLEWILDEEKPTAKKQVWIYKRDNAIMDSYKSTNYIAEGIAEDLLNSIIDIDQSTLIST